MPGLSVKDSVYMRVLCINMAWDVSLVVSSSQRRELPGKAINHTNAMTFSYMTQAVPCAEVGHAVPYLHSPLYRPANGAAPPTYGLS